MNTRIRSNIVNLGSDVSFLLMSILADYGFATLSGPANAMLLFGLYYVFIYLYRYVFIHQIGTGAKPLLTQLKIKLPKLIDYPIKGIFVLMSGCFPALILTLCLHIAQPVLQFDSSINPLTPALVGMFLVFTLIINAIIFLANGMSHERSLREGNIVDSIRFGYREYSLFPVPGETFRFVLDNYCIPLISILTVVSLSHVRAIWFSLDDPSEPWQILIMTLGAFVPFRYLILRIAGVSFLSMISLLTTITAICLVYLK